MPTIFATSRAAFFCPEAKKTAVAERAWFVVSFVTTPGWKPAFVSLSDALRASPVNVVPLRTATLTWPRLTLAGAAAPLLLEALPAPAVGDADPGGATVFGVAGGLSSLPPSTVNPTTTRPTTMAAPSAIMPASVPRERPPVVPRGRPARAAPAAVRGGTVACEVEVRSGALRGAGGAVARPAPAAVAGAGPTGGVTAPPPLTGGAAGAVAEATAGAGAGAGSTAVA